MEVRAFWAGFVGAALVTHALLWWIFSRHPLAAGAAGNREFILTHGLVRYSVPALLLTIALASLAGVPVLWLAAALGGDTRETATVATAFVLAFDFVTTVPAWLALRSYAQHGRNPAGIP